MFACLFLGVEIPGFSKVWKSAGRQLACGQIVAWGQYVVGIGLVLFLARRVFKNAWFERSIAEMGQSMGVTATGLLLLRVVDPDCKTPAAEAFACKQLLHEPFMGGGLWTGMAIPLIAAIGAAPVFGIACSAVFIWSALLFAVRNKG